LDSLSVPPVREILLLGVSVLKNLTNLP